MPHNQNNESSYDNDPLNNTPQLDNSRGPPQLNTTQARSRIGCACASSRGDDRTESEGGGGGGGGGGGDAPSTSTSFTSLPTLTSHPDTASDDGTASIDGDEGVEHQIEIGDLGKATFKQIFRALAKHRNCSCHCGVLPPDSDYPFPPFPPTTSSQTMSPWDSMIVEHHPSPDISLTSSLMLSRSASPGALMAHAGGWHRDEIGTVQPQFPRWLWLSPTTPLLQVELEFGGECDGAYSCYPRELSMSLSQGEDALVRVRGGGLW